MGADPGALQPAETPPSLPEPPQEELQQSGEAAPSEEQPADEGTPEVDSEEYRFDAVDESEPTPQTGEGEGVEAKPEQEEATEQKPPAEAGEAEPKAEADDLQAQIEKMLELDPERVTGALLATPRGKRMYSGFKTSQELAKPEAEGGIGHAPTEQQIRDYHKAHVRLSDMTNALISEEPERVAGWIKYHFGKNQEGGQYNGTLTAMERLPEVLMRENPHALNVLANTLPGVLSANPEIFKTYAQPFMDLVESGLREKAQGASAEPVSIQQSERSRLLDAANLAHFAATGEDLTLKPQLQPGAAPNAEVEVLRKEIAGLKQTQQTQQTQQTEQTAQANYKAIMGAIEVQLATDVDRALKAAEKTANPVTLQALRSDYANTLRGVANGAGTQRRLLEDRIVNIARSGRMDQVPELVQANRRLYQGACEAKRKGYLEAAGMRVMDTSKARHARLQQAAGRTEVNGVQQPTSKIVGAVGLPERQSDESREDWVQRTLREDMSRSLQA